MNKLISVICIIFICSYAFAQPIIPPARLVEEDGSPDGRPLTYIFENGMLTDNDDGSFTVYASGSTGVIASFNLYVLLDGETTDITNGTFNLTTTGVITVGGTGQSAINEGLVVNDNGGGDADDDFRVETVNEDQAFVVDASADLVRIGDFDTNYVQITSGGAVTFVGGASLEIPQATPAAPDVDGEIEYDFADGSLVIQHSSAHGELSVATDTVIGKLINSWSCTVFEPDNVNDIMTLKKINGHEFPHGVIITGIYLGVSANTSYTLTVRNYDDFDTINGANGTIDTVAYVADTTGEIFDNTPTFDKIASGQLVMLDIPATDVAWIHAEIYYYEPAS